MVQKKNADKKDDGEKLADAGTVRDSALFKVGSRGHVGSELCTTEGQS